jgi:hypothetical protein
MCFSNIQNKGLQWAREPNRRTPEEVAYLVYISLSEIAIYNIFGCSFAQRFWAATICMFHVEADVLDMHAYALPLSIPAPMSSTLFLMCCWNFWKHRNMSSPFVDGGQTSLVSTGTARLTLTSSRFAYHTNMCMEAMHGEPCPWRLNKARGSHPQKGDGSHSLLLVQVWFYPCDHVRCIM